MHLAFSSAVDSMEPDDERIAVRFDRKVGPYWVVAHAEELVASLKHSLKTGDVVEVVYDKASLELVDVKIV